MIKIFDAVDKDFSSNGNIVINPIKCKENKKKSLNGWSIDVEISSQYKKYIEKDKLCVVKTKSNLNPQAFRIGEKIEITAKKITFQAEHVIFDSKDYFLLDVRPINLDGLAAMIYINEKTDTLSPFKIINSDVSTISTAYFIRKSLLEAWKVIEERWKGVFDIDNWNVKFMQSIGKDNGETIIYGKNMQNMKIYEDWSNVVTKLYPVGKEGLLLPEKYIESNVKYEKPYTRTLNFETKLEQEEQTEANLIEELRKDAQEYINQNKYPKVSYEVNSDINQRMEIGDNIEVKHPFVTIETEVLEYEYDIVSRKITTIVFGNFVRDVKSKVDLLKELINKAVEKVSNQEEIIKKQTEIINSLNKNGYVYIDNNEILILDKLPKEEAENVWRWGLGGLGFSKNGYEGPFETAITYDGQINADFITAGKLSIERIEGLSNQLSEFSASIDFSLDGINAVVDKNKVIENEIINLKSDIKQSAENTEINFSKIGGNNLFLNSIGNFGNSNWKGNLKVYSSTEILLNSNAPTGNCFILQNGIATQEIILKNGTYTISFTYKKLLELAVCKVVINDIEYNLDSLEFSEFEQTIEISDNYLKFEIMGDTNNSCYILDLMCNTGNYKKIWSQNINEISSGTVNVNSEGLEIFSNSKNTKLSAGADSIRIKNINNNETVAEFTDKGTETEELIVRGQAQIAGSLFQQIGNQTWISSLL